MKDAVKDITNKFAEALDLRERWYHQQVFQGIKAISDAIKTLSVLRRDIEDARELVKGVHVVEGIGPTTALSEASKCLGLKWNLKDCQLDLAGGRLQDEGEGNSTEAGKVKDAEDDIKEEENEKEKEGKDEAEKEPPAELQAEDKKKRDKEKNPEVKIEETDVTENLTEDERRKQRKILRLKEKLAAASAAAEKKDYINDEKKSDLRLKKRNSKEKGEKEAVPKEIENDPKTKTDISSSPLKDDLGKNGDLNYKPDWEAETKLDSQKTEGKECQEESNKLRSESSFLAKIDPLPKNEPDLASSLKKPRSLSSRLSLKKSKTVTFMCPPENKASENDTLDDPSEDIKGLDLETLTLTHGNKDNKEREAEMEGREDRKQRQKKKTNNSERKEIKIFEMEPEEKERIATELLQVSETKYACVCA